MEAAKEQQVVEQTLRGGEETVQEEVEEDDAHGGVGLGRLAEPEPVATAPEAAPAESSATREEWAVAADAAEAKRGRPRLHLTHHELLYRHPRSEATTSAARVVVSTPVHQSGPRPRLASVKSAVFITKRNRATPRSVSKPTVNATPSSGSADAPNPPRAFFDRRALPLRFFFVSSTRVGGSAANGRRVGRARGRGGRAISSHHRDGSTCSSVRADRRSGVRGNDDRGARRPRGS